MTTDEQTQQKAATRVIASRVPAGVADDVRRRADERGVTVSDVIRSALTDQRQVEAER